MARTTTDVLEELEATSGSNAKRDILEAERSNAVLKKVFLAAQDPYVVYYVNKFRIPKPVSPDQGGSDLILERFLDVVLPRLASREVTGNEAKALVEREFASMNALEQKWCQRILLHNLRCGVQETSVNKVWPGLINSFSVALAGTLKSQFTAGKGIELLEPIAYPVRVEPKLDGLRCIAVKRAGTVTFFTRNGTVLETLPRVKAALEAASYDDLVLDGEAMGTDWNESASVLMSSKSKKDDVNIVYNAFDAMPLDDWLDKETTLQYHERCQLVQDVVALVANDRVRQVDHIMAQDEAQLKAFFARCMDEGYEGVMLKTLGTTYEWDRSRNIMKLKPCVTYEGTVVGWYEGRRETKRAGQFGGFYVLLPNHVITRVGGGFNDKLRAQIQLEDADTWCGRIAECEAQPDPLTPDGLTVDGKMRFPVYVRSRDKGDVDPRVPAAFDWWCALAPAEQQALMPLRVHERKGTDE